MQVVAFVRVALVDSLKGQLTEAVSEASQLGSLLRQHGNVSGVQVGLEFVRSTLCHRLDRLEVTLETLDAFASLLDVVGERVEL